jgi:DNA-binding response OmpR family regulator
MKRESPSVLVLEPNPLQRALIQTTLTRHQITPIICQDPRNLRQQLIDHLPDALLIDTYLPGHNGLDLIDQLNSDILRQRTKIFFLSAMGYPEIIQKAAKLGASGFLVKPFDPDLLVNRLRNSFDQPAPIQQ